MQGRIVRKRVKQKSFVIVTNTKKQLTNKEKKEFNKTKQDCGTFKLNRAACEPQDNSGKQDSSGVSAVKGG